MTKKPIKKVPLAIKIAHEAAEKAQIAHLQEAAVKAAYEHGWNDAVDKIREEEVERQNNLEVAKPGPDSKSWWDRIWE